MTDSDILNAIADAFNDEAERLADSGYQPVTLFVISLSNITEGIRTRAAKMAARDREIATASAAIDDLPASPYTPIPGEIQFPMTPMRRPDDKPGPDSA